MKHLPYPGYKETAPVSDLDWLAAERETRINNAIGKWIDLGDSE